jgi:uncharacterized protein
MPAMTDDVQPSPTAAPLRRDVQFASAGLMCSGWYYLPPDFVAGERRPAVVMAHGWGGVKEMSLPSFAEAFALAGFAVLVFDYRYLGASEGAPRGRIIPREQQSDYKNAITWLVDRPEVAADRVGIWGTSYSGGHVLVVAAEDRRVKAVVSHVPAVNLRWSTARWLRMGWRREAWHAAKRLLVQLACPWATLTIPIVNPPGQPATLPGEEAFNWLQRAARDAPTWRNEVTVRSLLAAMRYKAAQQIERIAPTPLLMSIASRDYYCFSDAQRCAFNRAGQPKQLLELDGGHFDFYAGEGLARVLPAHVDWFRRHLSESRAAGAV